jgi:chromosome segregation ATPase
MMGSSGGSSGEFGNVYDLIATLENPGAYEKKLAELDKRKQDATATLAQATEELRKAEAINKIAKEMFAAADLKLSEANQIKTDYTNRESSFRAAVAAHDQTKAEHVATVADFETYKAQAEADLKARVEQVTQREGALQAAEQATQAAKAQMVADIAAKYKAIEGERQTILSAANAELDKAKAVKAAADDVAAKIDEHRRSVEQMFGKIPVFNAGATP